MACPGEYLLPCRGPRYGTGGSPPHEENRPCTTPKPTPPPARPRRSPPPPSRAAIRPPHDVQIEILFCGICHSDLHTVRNEWSSVMPTVYPCVPGHEIVGRVTEGRRGGHEVQGGRPRRRRLPGRLRRHLPRVPGRPRAVLPEQVASPTTRPTSTSAASPTAATPTSIVVDERFVLRVPANLDLAGAAPLLCAGITTYSPLRHWGVTEGQEGRHRRPRRPRPHGREVRPRASARTSSSSRPRRARRRTRCASARTRSSSRRNADEMQKHAGSFDFILDTVSAEHDVNAYLQPAGAATAT